MYRVSKPHVSYTWLDIPNELLSAHMDLVTDACKLSNPQAVEAMELQDEASARVKLAVLTNAWRTRALNLLDGTAKPSLRHITKSIKEVSGIWCPIYGSKLLLFSGKDVPFQ